MSDALLTAKQAAALKELEGLPPERTAATRQYIEHLELQLASIDEMYVQFLNDTWALVDFPGEWEYPAQILRYLESDIEGYKKSIASYRASRKATAP